MSKEVGNRLKSIRELFGWSQRELAIRAGIPNNSTLSQIEQGKVSPSVTSLEKILSGVPMTLTEFFAFNPNAVMKVFHRAHELEDAHNPLKRSLSVTQPGRRLDLSIETWEASRDGGLSRLEPGFSLVIIVLSGQLHVEMAGQETTLRAGDGCSLQQPLPYRLRNNGDQHCDFARSMSFVNWYEAESFLNADNS